MDTMNAIKTKIEVRQFADKPVPSSIKIDVLEAARMTGSSSNTQHWRFLLLQEKQSVALLAEDSTSGKWVQGANFAIIILVNPGVPGHMIDAGRAVQDMQLAAWSEGIGSGIFTGINAEKLKKDFGIPPELQPAAVLGFGYSQKKLTGKKKKRNPLSEIAFLEKFGNNLDPKNLN